MCSSDLSVVCVVEFLIGHDVISDRTIAQDYWLRGCAKPLGQVSEKIQSLAAQPSAVRIATSAAQFRSVLRLAGTEDGHVVATWVIAVGLPIEPDQERRRYRIAE